MLLPLRSTSSRFALLVFLVGLFTTAASAAPTIKLIAPTSGASVGTPIYFEAYAYSSGCKAGISAIRLYSAPDTAAATVNSNHIETFIALNPGSYTTTLVAYDNCGETTAKNIPITVNANTGITVFLPSSSTAGTPVHVVASAKSYVCANDVKSMRIYTAAGVAPYSVFGNQVDAFLTLAPGTYNIVVQVWDNCGNVMKSGFALTASATPDRFLYSTGSSVGTNTDVTLLRLSNGTIGPSLGQVAATGATSTLEKILVDPAGYFLYTTDGQSIFAYQINRHDGSLQGVPGSPYHIDSGNTLNLAMDPNGHFLYVSDVLAQSLITYTIDRSDGSLQSPITMPGTPGGYLVTNYTGAYLYDFSYSSGTETVQISAFSVDMNTGFLTPLPGSPYTVPGTFTTFLQPAAAWRYLYLTAEPKCCTEETFAYEIGADGSLSSISGSPFVSEGNDLVLGTPVADWLTRYYWYPGQNQSSTEFFIETSDIDGRTGALSPNIATSTANGLIYEFFAEDHSGKYLYASGVNGSDCVGGGGDCADIFGSWTIGGNGQPVPLSGPVLSGYNTPGSVSIALAASR